MTKCCLIFVFVKQIHISFEEKNISKVVYMFKVYEIFKSYAVLSKL